MKKIRILSIMLMLVALIASGIPLEVFAEAGGSPTLGFSSSSKKTYAGLMFEAEVELSESASKDISFTVTGSDNSRKEGKITAGETTTVIELKAPDGNEESMTYTIDSGNGFELGKKASLTVKAYKAPEFTLGYEGIKYIKLGSTATNKIISSNRNYVVEATDFTLRLGSAEGEVIGNITLGQWGRSVEFDIKPEESWGRTAELYVCFDKANIVCGNFTVIVGDPERDYGIRRVETEEKKIAVSFDCAYGTEFTDYILDLLDEYDARVTFFVTGEWVEANPEYVVKIVERGHDIGNHSLTHPRLVELSDNEVFKELDTVSDRVEELTGTRPNVFRPPYGSYSSRIVAIADYCGCSTVLWTYDSLDWRTDLSAARIIKESTKDSAAGDILLSHNAAPLTKETLHVVLDYYTKELGLQIVSVGDLVYKGDRTVSEEGLVTAGSDYAYYTGGELFASRSIQADVQNLDSIVKLDLDLNFDDTRWFMYDDDASRIISGDNQVNAEISINEGLTAPITKGQELGTAVFSVNGQPDMTAKLVASRDVLVGVTEETQDDSEQSGNPEDGVSNTDLDQPDNWYSQLHSTERNVLIANMALIVAVVIAILVTKARKNR